MGQDASTPIDESTPPRTLNARTVEAVASYIKDGHAKKIVVMVSQVIGGLLGIVQSRTDLIQDRSWDKHCRRDPRFSLP